MTETSPLLSVRGFSKTYKDFVAVRDLSLDLHPGDIMALVGHNGAGKTTTLRAVCGILIPSAGTIVINGHNLAADPIAAKSAMAYVPDDPRLFDALTVWEHLRFVASAYGLRGWEPAAERLLEDFELTEKRESLTMELSRGMRQKVAVACAYLHDPRVILFDEPLTGLDPPGIRRLKDSITRRAADGAAIVFSSHLLGVVEDLCTRVLIMSRGAARFSGTIAQARERFAGGSGQATLEDVYFSATGGDDPRDGEREYPS